jgi:hypothetical protein
VVVLPHGAAHTVRALTTGSGPPSVVRVRRRLDRPRLGTLSACPTRAPGGHGIGPSPRTVC